VILGAWFGIVSTDGGTFGAPPAVAFALAGGLIIFAFLGWVPRQAPRFLAFVLPWTLVLAVAVVCNWTAFALQGHYTSEVTISLGSSSGEDQIGGRAVFGLVALAIDALVIGGLVTTART
jgi:hypothetical protein